MFVENFVNIRKSVRKSFGKSVAKYLTTFIAVILVTFITGCGSQSDSKTVNIGYFNNVTHAQALYMKNTGSLENALADVSENINVNWTAFNAGPAEVEALFAGSIDIGYIGPVPAITANVKSNGDVIVISSATKGGAVLVVNPASNINSVNELSGKTVAIPQIGNTQHLCLLSLLEENGLAPVTDGGDVNVTAVANADVANMMDRGDIDAALVPEPWGTILKNNGAKLLLDASEIYADGNYDVAVVVVRKDFYDAHPDIVEAFLAQHQAATDSINNNISESTAIINNEILNGTGKAIDEAVIAEAFTRIAVSTQLDEDSMLGLGQISFDNQIISSLPEKSQLFLSTNK